jgi:hypothetical protein
MPRLRTLDLGEIFVPLPEAVRDALTTLDRVTALRFSGLTEESAEWLTRWTSLDTLDLFENDADLGAEACAALARMPSLGRLRTPSSMDDDALSALAASASIHTLDLRNTCSLESESLVALTAFASLRELALPETADESVLEALVALPALAVLDIYDLVPAGPVSDAVARMPALRELRVRADFHDTSAIERARPEVRVVAR